MITFLLCFLIHIYYPSEIRTNNFTNINYGRIISLNETINDSLGIESDSLKVSNYFKKHFGSLDSSLLIERTIIQKREDIEFLMVLESLSHIPYQIYGYATNPYITRMEVHVYKNWVKLNKSFIKYCDILEIQERINRRPTEEETRKIADSLYQEYLK